jgi:hypothetical protein
VAIGKLDGDANLDLAVADCGSSDVSVLLGSGTGAFSAAQGSPFQVGVGESPVAVGIGELNGDSSPDIAVANSGGTKCFDPRGPRGGPGGSVSVLAGGDFGITRSFALLNDPLSIAISDLNADSRPDIAVANGRSRVVSVMLNATGGNPQVLAGDEPPDVPPDGAGG